MISGLLYFKHFYVFLLRLKCVKANVLDWITAPDTIEQNAAYKAVCTCVGTVWVE